MSPDLATATPVTRAASPALAWSPRLGLWSRPSPGHTRAVAHLDQVHSGVESAVLFHTLLELDRLDDATLSAALSGLLDLQSTSGPYAGCFRWYAEESTPVDTNAAFFIGLALQLFALGHPDRLSPSLQPRLTRAFALLNPWFLAELERESPIYPNKYLGDLVCAWLGHELLAQPIPPALLRACSTAFTRWETEPWGWGEHLSDVYAGVILTELSALLLFARHLPPDLHAQASRLATQLLALDDAYGSGPRVPQIRCYDFQHAPARTSFRAQVTPFPTEANEAWAHRRALKRYMRLPFGPLFARRGWASLFPTAPEPSSGQPLHTPLAAGAVAQAWIAPTLRTGTLSRWPLLPAAEHQAWGLSWQTFPAAFWRPAGDWGFLRFTTRSGESVRAHPAFDKHQAYLANALGPGDPPPIGLTASAQHGPDWIALRQLPPCPAWSEVGDGFWLHHLASPPVLEPSSPGWSTLRLPHPCGSLWLHHLAVQPGPAPLLRAHPNDTWSWSVTAPATSTPFISLWALSASPPPPDSAPRIEPAGPSAWRIRWTETPWCDLTLTLSDHG